MVILGIALAMALVLGLLTGTLGWCLFAVTSLALGMLVREVKAFFRWSKKPLRRPTNKDVSWDAATHRIYQRLQRERARTRDALEQLRSLQIVTEALPDGAIVVNNNGQIENLNSSARHLLNLSVRDKGRTLATLIRQPELVALLKDNYEDNSVEISQTTASFSEAGKQIEVRKFFTSDNRSTFLIRDVSERNRLLSMRQEFVANVSHELRTPLTVIVGYLETLQDDSVDQQTVLDVVARLRQPAQRMQALVDDLLLLTRLESAVPPGRDELDPVPLREMLEQIVAEGAALSNNQHQFELTLASDARIYGVETELYSCFSNLLTNAIRYSPGGGTIKIDWRDTQTGCEFAVTDEGTGIAPEHLFRLTERFYRVDLTGSRVRGGTGLGLAIVKHVLKRHNSTLAITSELGSGSEFCCSIPNEQLYRPGLADEPNTQAKAN